MSTPVEQIKERLGIADVVGSYMQITRAGSSLKAKCPFHNEKTPSFFVSPARNSYYCFGCQAHGDIFTFVQEFEGLDFVGALRVLAARAGVALTRIDPKVRSEHARLYLCLEKATRFYEEEFQRSDEAKSYLESRGLKPETIRAWRVGFAPNDWRQLFDHLTKEGFTPDEMKKVGLVKRPSADIAVNPLASGTPVVAIPAGVNAAGAASMSALRHYDAFRGRIMFPIRDSAGRVIAFSGRILPRFERPGADVERRVEPSFAEIATSARESGRQRGNVGTAAPKYINSPETVLFNKSETLYGFDRAKLVIRQKDAAILVEGQIDLLMAHQAGYENTVASSGTALTERQLERLKRLSENLLIAFDSDSAGLKAAERAIRLALSLGINVKVIALKEKDPADLILKDLAEWERAVKEAKHVIEFLSDSIIARTNLEKDLRGQALAIEKTLLPLVRLLSSNVEQSHFIKTISEKSGLREDALWDAFKKVPSAKRESDTVRASDSRRPRTLARRLFAILFHAENRKDVAHAERIQKELLRIFGEEALKKRADYFVPMKDVLLLEAESYYGDNAPSLQEEQELLRHLEEEYITVLLSETMDALALTERDGKKEESQALLQKCKDLTQKLATLKSARFLP